MKKKLRVAMYIASQPSVGGGVQEHVYYLSQALKKKGAKVDIFGAESNQVRYKNFTAISYAIDMPTLNGNWGYISILKPGLEIKKIISSKKYDILHIHEPYCPFATWDLIFNVPLPKVASFHNAWDNDSINNTLATVMPLFNKQFSDNVKGAIFVSEITQKRWLPLCSPETVKGIIYNGIDLKKFHPVTKKRKDGKIRILFVGRLVIRKGIKYFLKSVVPIVKELPHVQVSIMGKGPEYTWCQDFIRRHKIGTNVRLLGEIIGEKKIAHYQSADIFCAPYSDEAHPITILEAMSCGCTIVGFINEAVKETLRDYPGASLLVEPKKVAALTQALKKAIKDQNLRKTILAWNTKERLKYSWDKVAKQTIDMYMKVLK